MENLKKLGLSYYEAKALGILLKETLDARDLSKKARIPMGKIYLIINSLLEKNLIEKTDSRPVKLYVENASMVLNKLIEKKQNKDEQLFSELKAQATEIDRVKSKPTRFFQLGNTIEDNKNIQLRTFQEAEKEVCQILNIYHKPKSNRESKTLWEKEIEKAVRRGVTFRAIYPVNIDLPLLVKKVIKNHPGSFNVRRLDTDFTRCDIIDKKKILLKLVHEDATAYGGVIFIEDKKFANNLQKIFEEFWEQAK